MTIGLTPSSMIFSVVQKINITFVSGIGNVKNVVGTGFWIYSNNNKMLFITNKHNLVPGMHGFDDYRLVALKIDYRHFNPSLQMPFADTYDLDATDWEKYYGEDSDSPDIAILKMPEGLQMINPTDPHVHPYCNESLLAEASFYQHSLKVGDNCHFIGFPSHQRDNPLFDLPISRNCNISSLPLIDYYLENVRGVKTKEICLVGGFSFGGSSGSIVFSYPKGLKLGAGLSMSGGSNYVVPRLIGVMSGHWSEPVSDYFNKSAHTGLSYFTKSTAILDLMQKNNL